MYDEQMDAKIHIYRSNVPGEPSLHVVVDAESKDGGEPLYRHFAMRGDTWLELVGVDGCSEWVSVDEDRELQLEVIYAAWKSLAWTINH